MLLLLVPGIAYVLALGAGLYAVKPPQWSLKAVKSEDEPNNSTDSHLDLVSADEVDRAA